jgi:hypothetical protein
VELSTFLPKGETYNNGVEFKIMDIWIILWGIIPIFNIPIWVKFQNWPKEDFDKIFFLQVYKSL